MKSFFSLNVNITFMNMFSTKSLILIEGQIKTPSKNKSTQFR